MTADSIPKTNPQSEERLKARDDPFWQLFESAPDATIIAGDDGRISLVNSQAEHLFGYSHEELIGQPIEVLVPARYRATHRERHLAFLAFAERRPMGSGQALFAVRKDGSEFPVEISLSPAETRAGRVVIAAIRDIAERVRAQEALRRTEDQLRQAQKMEAVGALAGGIAHDFNNILSVVLSYSEFLLLRMPGDDPGRADVEEIRKASERAVLLTRQLLAFSRQQAVAPRVVDLNEILKGLERMLARLAGPAIELVVVAAHDLRRVRADRGQVEQVLMNLVVNARDAMPDGGQIRIETANLDVDEASPDVRPGAYAALRVTDTGIGMEAATRERVFEPFFTTKEGGKGTGLGLSVVYGIVKQSGGHIQIESQPGAGATFTVHFPETGEPLDEESPQPSVAKALRGTETVLLVEEDEQIRTIEVAVLRGSGYRIIEAQTAGDALLASERHRGPVALMVADVLMTRMNAFELASRLAPARPEMRVLYVSGRIEADAHYRKAVEAGAYLQKPITPDALLRKVREVLDRPERTSAAKRT